MQNLIGRSATAKIGQDERTATVASISRWEKDGMVRDYVNFDGSASRALGKVYFAVEGSARGNFTFDTPHGRLVGFYSDFASSGAKQYAVRELLADLFA